MLNKLDSLRTEKYKTKTGTNYPVFVFKCLCCDNEIKVQYGGLKTHSGKCRRCTQLGVPYAHIYNELKNHKNTKVDVSLSFDEFLQIIATSQCHYCDTKVVFNPYSKLMGKGLSRAYQLDRKDNKIGYTFDNCVVCCWECNRLKSDRFTYDEFIQLSPILKSIMSNRILNK